MPGLLFAAAAILGLAPVSGNFPRDLYGPVDTRPNCWGHADYEVLPIAFPSRPGYRVHLLRIRGDLIAWPKVLEGEPPVRRGAYAAVLAGFSTWDFDKDVSPDRTLACDFCAAGVPLYIQAGLADQPVRAAFDYDLREDAVYLTEGKLFLKLAAFLNTTGHPIHTEATYTLTYQFEKER